MSPAEHLSRPFQVLTWSLIVAVTCFVFFIMVASNRPANGVLPLGVIVIGAIMMLATLVSLFAFYVSLGMLAKRLDRSWIVWVGLTFLTAQFGGIFVAYFRMRGLVNNAPKLSTNEATP